MDETFNEVVDYWNRNPVHSVEFREDMDINAYLEHIDALRWSDNERWARENFYEFNPDKGKRF